MIFLMQFGINKYLLIFQRPQIALTLRAHAILLVFKKIYLCLFIPNWTQNHVITYTNYLIERVRELILNGHARPRCWEKLPIQKIAKGWKDSHGLLFFLRKGNLRGSLDSH